MFRTMLTGLCLVAVAAAAHAGTMRVPGDFDTIEDAVAAAAPGDVIQIGGRITVGTTIRGAEGLTFVGKGGATIAPPNDVTGLTFEGCTDISIRGLRFEGGDRGVLVRDCENVTIDRCRTRRTGDAGFDVRSSSDVTIAKCRVDDSGDEGITFGDSDGGETVSRGRIEKCRVKRCANEGFRVIGQDIDVVKCTSDDTGDDGFQLGNDQVVGSIHIRAEKCKVRRSDDEGFALFGFRVEAVRCSATIVDEEGFDVHGDGCLVERGKAAKCRRGIEFEGAQDSEAIGCKLVRNRESGIVLRRGATRVRVERCKMVRSGEDGLRIEAGCEQNAIVRNKAAGSGDVDLRDESAPGSNTFEKNRFKTTATEPID